MNKLFLGVIVMILLSIGACNTTKKSAGQSNKEVKTSTVESNAIAYEKLENALLWKISGNGVESPSYLYGTIHIIPSEEYFLPEGTLEAIGKSKKMYFEIDMKEMNDVSKQMGLLNQAFMKDDLTLKDLYTEEEYKKVKDHFEKMGIPLFFMERMKPMLLTVFASGDIDPGDLQSGKAKSYEMEFYEIAKDAKKETGGLETIEYQMSVFDSIPYEEQADMLLETIEMGDASNGSMQKMIEIYKQQDIEGMQDMFKEEESGVEGHEDVLLTNRNKNWIPVISEAMKGGTTFFAVGAGHLGGPQGVIHLLKEAGFTLEAVK
ncbi:TraB/GumN family protein [Portibacter lacus]|uniref:Lipoprotein n=1 Tax=Portibacter lacus TaxID=1099794 RepID=A0AA37SQC1_9BACT|nr:TraB/GumN family protein [Portibacter lacus]GLR17797.1 lipoprotein [Portibacter lacus]